MQKISYDFLFQILRDIKQGLLQLGKEGIRGPLSGGTLFF